MKLWHLTADANNYNNLVPIKSADWRKLWFNGVSLQNNWEPVAVRFIYERKEGDYPSLLPGIPVFSDKAVIVLYDLIKDSAEILPLRCRKGKYYAANVIEVINAINYEKSIVERFPSSGRIMLFDKYSFKHECVIGKHIFKISDEPKRRPFVSDEFRNRVINSGLTGFLFELVWDSEDD